MISGLLYVSFAVESVDQTRQILGDLLGLPIKQMDADPYLGTDRGARVAFPNGCWLYIMEGKYPGKPVAEFLRKRGPGLERIALLTDEIEAHFDHVRRGGICLVEDDLVESHWGKRFTVPGEDVYGVTVEICQIDEAAWEHSAPTHIAGILGLQHIGAAVRDLTAACERFEELFGLAATGLRTDQHYGEQKDAMIHLGNDRLWLHVAQSWGSKARVREYLDRVGPGLEHLCVEVSDIRAAVMRTIQKGVPLFENKIFTNRPDGFEAFVYPEHTTGITIELIEPFPTSRGYRFRNPDVQSC